jgi:hypothetical protein
MFFVFVNLSGLLEILKYSRFLFLSNETQQFHNGMPGELGHQQIRPALRGVQGSPEPYAVQGAFEGLAFSR